MTNFAKVTVMRTALNRLGVKMRLQHYPAGLYIAGAGTRVQDNEQWGWQITLDNATHGQRYKTLAEAENAFNARLPESGP